jgi:hypothetical protein
LTALERSPVVYPKGIAQFFEIEQSLNADCVRSPPTASSHQRAVSPSACGKEREKADAD